MTTTTTPQIKTYDHLRKTIFPRDFERAYGIDRTHPSYSGVQRDKGSKINLQQLDWHSKFYKEALGALQELNDHLHHLVLIWEDGVVWWGWVDAPGEWPTHKDFLLRTLYGDRLESERLTREQFLQLDDLAEDERASAKHVRANTKGYVFRFDSITSMAFALGCNYFVGWSEDDLAYVIKPEDHRIPKLSYREYDIRDPKLFWDMWAWKHGYEDRECVRDNDERYMYSKEDLRSGLYHR